MTDNADEDNYTDGNKISNIEINFHRCRMSFNPSSLPFTIDTRLFEKNHERRKDSSKLLTRPGK